MPTNPFTVYLIMIWFLAEFASLGMRRAVRWKRAKKLWFEHNRPTGGYYKCYLCGQFVGARKVSLDHVIRVTDLRFTEYDDVMFNIHNIRPTHLEHNELRGKLMESPKELVDYMNGKYGIEECILAQKIISKAQADYCKFEQYKQNPEKGLQYYLG